MRIFLNFLLVFTQHLSALEEFIIEPNSVWHFHPKEFGEKDWEEPEFSDHSWD